MHLYLSHGSTTEQQYAICHSLPCFALLSPLLNLPSFPYLVPASQSQSVPKAALSYFFLNSFSEFVVLNYGFIGLACVSRSLLC
jgi:hypothetical protein